MTLPAQGKTSFAYSRSAAFLAILVIVYLFGSYASLNTNIAQDTEQEQNTLRVNLNAVSGLLHGDTAAYLALQDYSDKYYGVGFHALAYPFQVLLYHPVANILRVNHETAFILVKHWLTFNLHFASAILILFILRCLTNDRTFEWLAALAYLLWPYLFGHAVFNVKDPPFLFAWLLCTWLSFSIVRSYCAGQHINRRQALLIGLCTGWLIGIRIAGGLIAFQYLATMLCAWRIAGWRTGAVRQAICVLIPISVAGAILMALISSPVFWANPGEIIGAIKYMSHHPMAYIGICVLTYGKYLPVSITPSVYYIPLWLSVKLPLMIIAGYALMPLALRKTAADGTSAGIPGRIFILAIAGTSLLIPGILIALHATLYNDLRQILFLMPLFYLSGVLSLYRLSRKAAIASLIASIGIFTADNFMAFPYQYIWFNEASRQLEIDRYFETDYWNSSSKNSYDKLIRFLKTFPAANCIYLDMEILGRHARLTDLDPTVYSCVKPLDDVTPATQRPFIAVAPNSASQKPTGCSVISEEKFHLLMSNGHIHLRNISYCR